MKKSNRIKRIAVLFITATMILSSFAACSSDPEGPPPPEETKAPEVVQRPGGSATTLPSGLNGTDAAKLLLAGQRLSDHLINTEDSIFENGAETYRALAEMTSESIRAARAETLSSVVLKSPRSLSSLTQAAVISQTVYTEISEFCRSYEIFKETANKIISNAESGARMIDYAKKYIRAVDTWVTGYNGTSDALYLHVEENSETLYQVTPLFITVCHRYKNEKGQDVYELYEERLNTSFISVTRSTYISGERYELTSILPNDRYDVLVAENTKGYWEVFSNSSSVNEELFPGEVLHSPQFFILKDDICYSFYHLYRYGGMDISLVNAARTADIICESREEMGVRYTIMPGTFEGVSSVTAGGGGISTIQLKNGEVLSEGAYYIDGKRIDDPVGASHDLAIESIRAGGTAWGVEVTLDIRVTADSTEQAREILKRQLNEWGLTSKYGELDKLFSELDRASDEADSMIKYHKWNGYSSASAEGMTPALEVEKERIEAMKQAYEAVKDAPRITLTDKFYEEGLGLSFLNVAENTSTGVTLNGSTVTVENLELVLNDTLLLVDDEPYAVFFAIKPNDSDSLTHITLEERSAVKYAGEKSFRVASGKVRFTLPTMTVGEYTLVAYLATADGIRTSKPIPVTFDSVVADEMQVEDLIVTSVKAQDGSLTVKYEANPDVYLTLSKTAEAIDYAKLHEFIASAAFSHGTPSESVIERRGEGGVYTALTGEETSIEEGEYRLAYSVKNGDTTREGYVYVTYAPIDEKTATEK